jgi:hypothetical protein
MNRLLALALTVVVLALTNDVLAGSEELCGTWINMDYDNISKRPTRVIFKPDGKFEMFRTADATIPGGKGTYKITEKWTDSAGNIFYKYLLLANYGVEYKLLCKLSKSGKILEYMQGFDEYPTEITTSLDHYFKYTRE